MKKEKIEFTLEEIEETKQLLGQLKSTIGETLNANDEAQLREQLTQAIADGKIQRDVFGLNPVLQSLRTAQIAVDEIGLKRDGVLATILFTLVIDGHSPKVWRWCGAHHSWFGENPRTLQKESHHRERELQKLAHLVF